MPQDYGGGAVFLAQAVLAEDDLPGLEAATRLGPAQQARLRRIMEAAHRARRIPAGDSAFLARARDDGGYELSRAIVIDDERLHYIWNRFREHAVLLVKALMPHADALQLADRLAAGFRTPACRALLARYRQQYDRRRPGSDAVAAALRRDILAHVDAQLGPRHPHGFLRALFKP